MRVCAADAVGSGIGKALSETPIAATGVARRQLLAVLYPSTKKNKTKRVAATATMAITV